MVPPAPPWFSMITVPLSSFANAGASTRATVSLGPPAAAGTTIVIGFVGYGWAIATGAPRAINRNADVTSLLNTFPPAGRMSGPVAGAVVVDR
jgi:hypothetical protein